MGYMGSYHWIYWGIMYLLYFIVTHSIMGIPGYPSTNHCSGMGLVFLSLQKLDLVMVSFLPCNHRQQLKMLVNRRRPVGDQCVLCSLRAPVWKAVNHFLLPDLTSPKKLWTWPKQNHYSMAEKLPEHVWKLFWSVYIIIFSYCWNVQLSDFTRVSRPQWILDEAPRESLGILPECQGNRLRRLRQEVARGVKALRERVADTLELAAVKVAATKDRHVGLRLSKEINRGFYIRIYIYICEY